MTKFSLRILQKVKMPPLANNGERGMRQLLAAGWVVGPVVGWLLNNWFRNAKNKPKPPFIANDRFASLDKSPPSS